jgi:predicted NAD-dependent protein-ADP-ribosyltransferase YbiA (DUF1768 family)
MNIGSGNGWPSSALSNFAGHRFVIDGVECYSFEGFLQSLKFDKAHIQVEVCKLIGKAAKFRGKARNKAWRQAQTLWWKGYPIPRGSEEYKRFLLKAYCAMFDQSEGFRNALLATKGMKLTHSIGSSDPSQTILTEREFCSLLTYVRDRYATGDGK